MSLVLLAFCVAFRQLLPDVFFRIGNVDHMCAQNVFLCLPVHRPGPPAIISTNQEIRAVQKPCLKPLLLARTAQDRILNLLFFKYYKEGVSAPIACYPFMGLIEIHHLAS